MSNVAKIYKPISGSGGGGGKGSRSTQSTPTEAPNTLQSKSVIKIVDLLGFGPVDGLANDAQSIYLNDTPLQNADGTYNFEGVSWEERIGNFSQSYVPGFGQSGNEVNVGVEVFHDTPVTRSVTNSAVDWVSLKLRIPALSQQETDGDIVNASVTVAIDINGSNKITDVITGKTTSTYERAYKIDVSSESFPLTLTMRRVSADSESQVLQNRTFFASYSEIIDSKFQYPNCAYVALTIDAQQFGGQLPARSYEIKGRTIRVPSNYDQIARTYSGSWDGTFKTVYSNNPAWVLYDLLTDSRYGLGASGSYSIGISDADINKYTFYSVGQYCDGLVPDGNGSTEPRYTFNYQFTQQLDAAKFIADVLASFHANLYWSNGQLNLMQDAPGTVRKLVNRSNVLNGEFIYSSTPLSQRHSVAETQYLNPELGYELDTVTTEDHDSLLELGDKKVQTTVIGCTSIGQAIRVGRWILDSEKYQRKTVTYTAGLDHINFYPGEIVAINDPDQSGRNADGRIVSVSGTTVTLDRELTLESGESYIVKAVSSIDSVEERIVTTAAGNTNTLTISSAFSETIEKGAVFLLQSNVLSNAQFRATSIVDNGDNTYSVTAIEHDPNKYTRIENDVFLPPPTTSLLTKFALKAPKNIILTHSIIRRDNTATNLMVFSWDKGIGDYAYEYQWSNNSGVLSEIRETTTPNFQITGPDGTYTIKVRAMDIIGRKTIFSQSVIAVSKKSYVIGDVENFLSVRSGKTILLSWDDLSDPMLDKYEIRHGNTWQDSQLVSQITTNSLTVYSSRGGKFFIKAKSLPGSYSKNAAVVEVFGELENLIVDRNEKTLGWPGARNNLVLDFSKADWSDLNTDWSEFDKDWPSLASIGNSLALLPKRNWTDLPSDWTLFNKWYEYPDVGFSGTYETDIIDLGVVLTSSVNYQLTIDSIAKNDWTRMTGYWTDYGSDNNWDWTGRTDFATYKVYITTSDDGVNYTELKELKVGFHKFRYFKLKVNVTLNIKNYIAIIKNLRVFIDVPDIIETRNDENIGDSGKTITYNKSFNTIPSVVVAIQNGSVGDTIKLTNKTKASVDIAIFDSAGNQTSGVSDIVIQGY